MDVFSQNPEAKSLCEHLASAIMAAAPPSWEVAELEVRVSETASGITREYRIISPQHRGQSVCIKLRMSAWVVWISLWHTGHRLV